MCASIPLAHIPFVLEVAGVLATFVTQPVHGPRLCEAAASSVQICSRQICHPNHVTPPVLPCLDGIAAKAAYE
ncbi:hypothetical protein CEQ36_13440 [Yersinia intermedia]|nr:hypothetical protein A6J67_22990 [Yersinia sp. FDAARGOS_228]AVL36503.1 hypothetical protein CEQ36_13440 [Yersinia intermedia]